ncbi:MAG: phage late control D family protein [Bryobacteraceae bacterium]
MSSPTLLPVNIFEGQDFYVPAYRIVVNAQELEIESDVISVTYTDSLTNVDSFEMVVNNWDPDGIPGSPATGAFKYSDTDTFNPWQQVELWMGYYHNGNDELERMLTGEISTMSPNFPSGGGSTLTVRALNLLHRFRTKQETKAYFNKKDTEIAQDLINDIASDLRQKIPQLTLEMDPDEVQQNLAAEEQIPYLEMHNQYPIVFLLQRARDIGYELFIEEQGTNQQRTVIVHFLETGDVVRHTYVVEWGKSLISFQPTLQTANQVSDLTVTGWNPQTKQPIKVQVTRQDLANEGVIDPTALNITESELSQKSELVVDHPVQSQAEARMIALKRMRQIAQGLVEARGKTLGTPDLRSGCKLQIAGLGTRFSGTYLVTSTTHTIGDGGYTTDFTARMEAAS